MTKNRRMSQLEKSWREPPSQQTLDWIWYLIICAREIVKTNSGDLHPVLIKAADEITATTLSTYIALEQIYEHQNIPREFKQLRRQNLRVLRKIRLEHPASKRSPSKRSPIMAEIGNRKLH